MFFNVDPEEGGKASNNHFSNSFCKTKGVRFVLVSFCYD